MQREQRQIDKPILCECLCGARDEIPEYTKPPACWLCGKTMMIYGRRK